MKRDLELIRRMVLAIEDAPSGFAPDLRFEGYTQAQIGYHAYLLMDAGLARGADATTYASDAPQAIITSLTWDGHEFAEAARDESRWKRARGIVVEKAGTITFDVLKQLLGSLMKAALDLP